MSSSGTERRLAAVLSADAVAYSRHMGEDDLGTVQVLTAHREAIETAVDRFHGRVVDSPGDNLLAEFPSANDALACALATQAELARRNAEMPHDKRLEFRIGLHLGDLVIDEGRLYGEGINIAARLEGLADPGGIALSGDLYRQVRSKLGRLCVDEGEIRLKNIAEPVRVYRIGAEAPVHAGSPAAGAAPPDLLSHPTVAVLPFRNLSGDLEQEYFADGITEDVITALSYWRCFPVIARNTTYAYKGKAIDAKTIREEIGARYLLEGSVRRAGTQIRITAQLSETTTGRELWADRYDRALSDVFELQDEITRRIIESLEPELSRAEQQRSRVSGPSRTMPGTAACALSGSSTAAIGVPRGKPSGSQSGPPSWTPNPAMRSRFSPSASSTRLCWAGPRIRLEPSPASSRPPSVPWSWTRETGSHTPCWASRGSGPSGIMRARSRRRSRRGP
ncbi:MAG: adenylate/guanylate cyclase domain-containing protein [Myxococcota bacterium]